MVVIFLYAELLLLDEPDEELEDELEVELEPLKLSSAEASVLYF